jgi:hypothetical protein
MKPFDKGASFTCPFVSAPRVKNKSSILRKPQNTGTPAIAQRNVWKMPRECVPVRLENPLQISVVRLENLAGIS